jgi:hypothetical protein
MVCRAYVRVPRRFGQNVPPAASADELRAIQESPAIVMVGASGPLFQPLAGGSAGMQAFLIRVAFVVATTAVGRGIVFAFGLDKRVAGIINIARESRCRPAIAWIISGVFGLTMLMLWEVFHVDEIL